MIVKFRNKTLEKLCTDKKAACLAFSPKIADEIGYLMYDLYSAPYITDFFQVDYLRKTYRTHYLKGKKDKEISLSLDRKYRTVVIKINTETSYEDTIEIIEVDNHYGD